MYGKCPLSTKQFRYAMNTIQIQRVHWLHLGLLFMLFMGFLIVPYKTWEVVCTFKSIRGLREISLLLHYHRRNSWPFVIKSAPSGKHLHSTKKHRSKLNSLHSLRERRDDVTVHQGVEEILGLLSLNNDMTSVYNKRQEMTVCNCSIAHWRSRNTNEQCLCFVLQCLDAPVGGGKHS